VPSVEQVCSLCTMFQILCGVDRRVNPWPPPPQPPRSQTRRDVLQGSGLAEGDWTQARLPPPAVVPIGTDTVRRGK